MALQQELRSQGDFLFKHRSYLPVIIIVIGLIVFVQGQIQGTIDQSWLGNKYEFGCFLVSIFGLFIRIYAVGYSADNTSGRNTSAGQIADSINTTGLYSICRHPLYVGNFFMWLGICGFTENFWFIIAFILLYWLYYERIMYAEEAFLTSTYGEKYTNWASKVPAFVPNLSTWKKPERSFNWIKIIRQEKSGILSLFVVIFLFELVGEYTVYGTFFKHTHYSFYGVIFALIYYGVIKIIQKNTQLLAS